ncbi:hypothetical protein T484DRAFT_1778795 [Baffinella frigidus]|nr:hypothetical protein T484DRAFT_1778795 [Cryptophyta sp. CCMP2293]
MQGVLSFRQLPPPVASASSPLATYATYHPAPTASEDATTGDATIGETDVRDSLPPAKPVPPSPSFGPRTPSTYSNPAEPKNVAFTLTIVAAHGLPKKFFGTASHSVQAEVLQKADPDPLQTFQTALKKDAVPLFAETFSISVAQDEGALKVSVANAGSATISVKQLQALASKAAHPTPTAVLGAALKAKAALGAALKAKGKRCTPFTF